MEACKKPGKVCQQEHTERLTEDIAPIRQRIKKRESEGKRQQTQCSKSQPPEEHWRCIGDAIRGKLRPQRRRLLVVGDLLRGKQQGAVYSRKIRTGRRQLHAIQQFLKELPGRIWIGIVTHKDARRRMIEDGIALVGTAIVEHDTKQVRVILKLRRQVKT